MNHDELTAAYERQLVALLPEGPAWEGFRAVGGRGRKFLRAKADLFATAHGAFDRLLAELPPWRARDTLAVREAEVGLPDDCTRGRATTVAERRQAVGAKWLGAGAGHRPEDFEAIAAAMGYAVTVRAQRPARCGSSRCGEVLNPPSVAHHLRVVVHGARKTRARCGLSQCGDPLLKIQRAEDLECRLRKKVHTHVDLSITYEEA